MAQEVEGLLLGDAFAGDTGVVTGELVQRRAAALPAAVARAVDEHIGDVGGFIFAALAFVAPESGGITEGVVIVGDAGVVHASAGGDAVESLLDGEGQLALHAWPDSGFITLQCGPGAITFLPHMLVAELDGGAALRPAAEQQVAALRLLHELAVDLRELPEGSVSAPGPGGRAALARAREVHELCCAPPPPAPPPPAVADPPAGGTDGDPTEQAGPTATPPRAAAAAAPAPPPLPAGLPPRPPPPSALASAAASDAAGSPEGRTERKVHFAASRAAERRRSLDPGLAPPPPLPAVAPRRGSAGDTARGPVIGTLRSLPSLSRIVAVQSEGYTSGTIHSPMHLGHDSSFISPSYTDGSACPPSPTDPSQQRHRRGSAASRRSGGSGAAGRRGSADGLGLRHVPSQESWTRHRTPPQSEISLPVPDPLEPLVVSSPLGAETSRTEACTLSTRTDFLQGSGELEAERERCEAVADALRRGEGSDEEASERPAQASPDGASPAGGRDVATDSHQLRRALLSEAAAALANAPPSEDGAGELRAQYNGAAENLRALLEEHAPPPPAFEAASQTNPAPAAAEAAAQTDPPEPPAPAASSADAGSQTDPPEAAREEQVRPPDAAGEPLRVLLAAAAVREGEAEEAAGRLRIELEEAQRRAGLWPPAAEAGSPAAPAPLGRPQPRPAAVAAAAAVWRDALIRAAAWGRLAAHRRLQQQAALSPTPPPAAAPDPAPDPAPAPAADPAPDPAPHPAPAPVRVAVLLPGPAAGLLCGAHAAACNLLREAAAAAAEALHAAARVCPDSAPPPAPAAAPLPAPAAALPAAAAPAATPAPAAPAPAAAEQTHPPTGDADHRPPPPPQPPPTREAAPASPSFAADLAAERARVEVLQEQLLRQHELLLCHSQSMGSRSPSGYSPTSRRHSSPGREHTDTAARGRSASGGPAPAAGSAGGEDTVTVSAATTAEAAAGAGRRDGPSRPRRLPPAVAGEPAVLREQPDENGHWGRSAATGCRLVPPQAESPTSPARDCVSIMSSSSGGPPEDTHSLSPPPPPLPLPAAPPREADSAPIGAPDWPGSPDVCIADLASPPRRSPQELAEFAAESPRAPSHSPPPLLTPRDRRGVHGGPLAAGGRHGSPEPQAGVPESPTGRSASSAGSSLRLSLLRFRRELLEQQVAEQRARRDRALAQRDAAAAAGLPSPRAAPSPHGGPSRSPVLLGTAAPPAPPPPPPPPQEQNGDRQQPRQRRAVRPGTRRAPRARSPSAKAAAPQPSRATAQLRGARRGSRSASPPRQQLRASSPAQRRASRTPSPGRGRSASRAVERGGALSGWSRSPPSRSARSPRDSASPDSQLAQAAAPPRAPSPGATPRAGTRPRRTQAPAAPAPRSAPPAHLISPIPPTAQPAAPLPGTDAAAPAAAWAEGDAGLRERLEGTRRARKEIEARLRASGISFEDYDLWDLGGRFEPAEVTLSPPRPQLPPQPPAEGEMALRSDSGSGASGPECEVSLL